MPSRELYRLCRGVLVWFAWFALTLNPAHGRSYGELRRLSVKDVAVNLAPMGVCVGTVVWFHLYFPDQLLPWAAASWGGGLAFGGTLVVTMFLITRLSDWHLARMGTK